MINLIFCFEMIDDLLKEFMVKYLLFIIAVFDCIPNFNSFINLIFLNDLLRCPFFLLLIYIKNNLFF